MTKITIAVDAEDAGTIKRAAMSDKRSISNYVRKHILDDLRGNHFFSRGCTPTRRRGERGATVEA